MVKTKIECNGVNFKVILLNGKLIITPNLKLTLHANRCLTLPLNQVKLIEFSAKSIVPPIIYFFISSLLFLTNMIFYNKFLPNFFKSIIIILLALALIFNFSLVIIRSIFGSLKIESENVILKIDFVKKREAENLISTINYFKREDLIE
ncbi:MAG: hypothetical protein QXL69_03565 [Candidatus Bathyarchaeia archaeon]|nr:hypothetical protein [Candidatus Bathyarchaeota archaeon]